MQSTTDPVANSANPANYQPELKEISNDLVIENEAPKLAKLAKLATPANTKTIVSCGKCLHFKCYNAHGQGAGRCLIGGDYGQWSETQHQSDKFAASTVTCYTPNGKAIEVEAIDPEHSLWLER